MQKRYQIFSDVTDFYGAKIIPNRGAWLEIETDTKNIIYVKIDRKRKIPITAILRAFGYDTDKDEPILKRKKVDKYTGIPLSVGHSTVKK